MAVAQKVGRPVYESTNYNCRKIQSDPSLSHVFKRDNKKVIIIFDIILRITSNMMYAIVSIVHCTEYILS